MRYNKKYTCCLCVFIMACSSIGIAQPPANFPPPATPVVVSAAAASEPITVDGRLNEAAWQQAPVITDFFRTEPRQGGAYRYRTYARILFDRKNLYFGFFCKDSTGKKGIRVQDYRRDFTYPDNDLIAVQLDPQNLKRYCVSFQTTPLGNQRDLQLFDDSFKDNDWDALWSVRTTITDSGYYAEFSIPFKSIRYNKPSSADSISWGLTFYRLARRNFEQTVFPAIPQAFSPMRMTYAAQLRGLQLPPPSSNIRVQPYSLFQSSKSNSSAGQANSSNRFKAGGDIKWAINPRSVLDITFNTDFAQADVDRAVNNLTRFNVFFPERRQFFLENSGIYSGADIDGIKPFFSRTIGLANAQFNAGPVPLDGGIRYTDRNAKRTLAALYVHQRSTEEQPGANFAVLRYLKNYGSQNNIGIMLTQRIDEANGDKGIPTHNNTTLTVDGLTRPKDDITIQYLASASRDNTNDSIGFSGSFYAGYFPNNYYIGWLTKYVDEKYVPGMGFVFANNTIHHNPGGYYIWRPKKGWLSKMIRRWDPGVFINYYQNASDLRFQSGDLYIFPVYVFFRDNSQLNYSLTPTWENFFFSPLGISVAPGKYFFTRHQVSYATDASRKISGNGSYTWGRYYDGRLQEINLSCRIAPDPKVAFTASYQLNRISNLGILKSSENISLWSLGCRLAANARMQLSSFYQYNTFDRRGQLNIRASWEFAPLSFLYVVFNENNLRGTPVKNKSLISKVSYLKQL